MGITRDSEREQRYRKHYKSKGEVVNGRQPSNSYKGHTEEYFGSLHDDAHNKADDYLSKKDRSYLGYDSNLKVPKNSLKDPKKKVNSFNYYNSYYENEM